MKKNDTIKLVMNEFRYKKSEWCISILLQVLIFSCAFFVFILSMKIDDLGSEYLQRAFPTGFVFSLSGYGQEDYNRLKEWGFENISIDELETMGTLDNIDGIWWKKLFSLLKGKDIWNREIDEFLSFISILKVFFFILAILLIYVMINNLSNSFTMKIIHRAQYIKMLFELGACSKLVLKIYVIYWNIKSFIAAICALVINYFIIVCFNNYVKEIFGIKIGIPLKSIFLGFFTYLIFEIFMRMSIIKIWRKYCETNRYFKNSSFEYKIK